MAVSPSVQVNVSGARGRSFADQARQTGAYDVLPGDDDEAVLIKFAAYVLEENPGFKGDKGDPGAAGNVAANLAQLKAAATTNVSMLYDGVTFNWTLGDFTGEADDINIVKANSTALSVGAWLRQSASKVAVTLGLGDDTPIRTIEALLRGLPISIENFRATGMSDAEACQAMFDYAAANGGDYFFERDRTYTFDEQCTLLVSYADLPANIRIIGAGAIIQTEGAISAIKVQGFAYPRKVILDSFFIDHIDNTEALAGIELVQNQLTVVQDCSVAVKANTGDYAAVLVRNADADDEDTGSFWNHINNLNVRSPSSADDKAPYGIRLMGAANATNIRGGTLINCSTCIHGEAQEDGNGYTANSVVIDSVSFEHADIAVHLRGNLTADDASWRAPSGWRITNCRVEVTTTFLKLSGSGANQPSVPVHLSGNYSVFGVDYMVNDPDDDGSLDHQTYYDSDDVSITPDFSGVVANRTNYGPRTWTSILSERPAGEFRKLDNGPVFALTYQPTPDDIRTLLNFETVNGSKMRVGYGAIPGTTSQGSRASYYGVGAISGTAVDGNNLAGTKTLASGTATVTLSPAEPDVNYRIVLSGNAGETFYWGSKGTGGFTINSSNAASTAIVDWFIVRGDD